LERNSIFTDNHTYSAKGVDLFIVSPGEDLRNFHPPVTSFLALKKVLLFVDSYLNTRWEFGPGISGNDSFPALGCQVVCISIFLRDGGDLQGCNRSPFLRGDLELMDEPVSDLLIWDQGRLRVVGVICLRRWCLGDLRLSG
jgi:hypothetical protein